MDWANLRRIPANTIMSLKGEVTAISLYFKYPFIRITIERGGLRYSPLPLGGRPRSLTVCGYPPSISSRGLTIKTAATEGSDRGVGGVGGVDRGVGRPRGQTGTYHLDRPRPRRRGISRHVTTAGGMTQGLKRFAAPFLCGSFIRDSLPALIGLSLTPMSLRVRIKGVGDENSY